MAAIRDNSLDLIFYEVMQEILQRSNNTDELTDFFTQKIAELFGASMVTLSVVGKESIDFNVRFFPQEKEDCLNKPGIKIIIKKVFDYDTVQYHHKDSTDESTASLIDSCSFNDFIGIPLRVGKHREGVLVLFEINDKLDIDRKVTALNKLSGVLALISRNTYLHESLKFEVKQRTLELDHFFDQPQNVHLIADISGTILRVNQGFISLLGYSAKEVLNKNFLFFVHPEDQEGTVAEMEKLEKGITVFSFSNRYKHQNEQWIWLEWSAIYSKEVNRLFAVARDVTDQRKAEEKAEMLARQQSRLIEEYKELSLIDNIDDLYHSIARLLNSEIPNSVILINSVDIQAKQTKLMAMEGLDDAWLTKVAKVVGYNMIGQEYDLLPHYEAYLQEAKLKEFGDNLGVFSAGQFSSRTGSTLSKLLGIKNIYSIGFVQQGELMAAIHILLRGSKRIEQATYIELLMNQISLIFQQRRNDLLVRQAIAAKDKVFSIIGHDLRGPLGHIMNFSELLNAGIEDHSNESLREFGSIIQYSSEKLMALLDDLLLWSKSQSIGEVIKQEINLFQVVEDALGVPRIGAEQKQITIINKVRKGDSILVDETKLITVIRNLVSNAIKFSYAGGKIFIKSRSLKNGQIVSVEDAGVGMTDKQIQNLFNAETNQSTMGTQGEKGTGLGLDICQYYIKSHGGRLWVDSQVGQGSKFFIWIPNN